MSASACHFNAHLCVDCTADFAGQQLQVLSDDVLGYDNSVFTDYTDTDGKWITEGKDRTVWTR